MTPANAFALIDGKNPYWKKTPPIVPMKPAKYAGVGKIRPVDLTNTFRQKGGTKSSRTTLAVPVRKQSADAANFLQSVY